MPDTEFDRIRQAYLTMAKEVNYRPYAPSDGVGGILLTDDQLKDDERLSREASDYASAFCGENDSRSFFIGVTNWETNRATVYAIEAARLMCGAAPKKLVSKLLNLALIEVQKAAH